VRSVPPTIPPRGTATPAIASLTLGGSRRARRVADLKERFPDESKRVLSTSFLEKLLTKTFKGFTMHRHGVRIRNAVFVGALDLENAEIQNEVWLDSCRFEEGVNLSQTVFQKSISFEGSSFKTATFNSLKVGARPSFVTQPLPGRWTLLVRISPVLLRPTGPNLPMLSRLHSSIA
jgi:hypothetical protein